MELGIRQEESARNEQDKVVPLPVKSYVRQHGGSSEHFDRCGRIRRNSYTDRTEQSEQQGEPKSFKGGKCYSCRLGRRGATAHEMPPVGRESASTAPYRPIARYVPGGWLRYLTD